MTYRTRPPLSREEEVSLGRRAQAGDAQAREELIESYVAWVVASAAKVRCPTSMERDDLIQEGLIGLMDAIDHWDVDRGFRFLTMARHYVYGRMMRSCHEQAGVIRVPENEWRRRRKTGERQELPEPVPLTEANDVKDPSPSVEDQVLRRLAIERALERMTPKQREVFIWRAKGLNQSEIAYRLGITQQSVVSREKGGRRAAQKED